MSEQNISGSDANNGMLSGVDEKARLEAQVKNAQAQHDALLQAALNPTSASQPVAATETVITPVVKPVEVPVQFKNQDGTPNIEKINASAQQLEAKNKEIADALAKYKTLQSEFTKGSQELATVKKATPEPVVSSEDFKKELASLLEKDPVAALERAALYGATAAEAKLVAARSEQEAASLEAVRLSKLDALKDAHPWVVTEDGFAAISEALKSRPYLFSHGNPDVYADAIKFVDTSRFQGQTQRADTAPQPRTPVLGPTGGVPPPVSPVSDAVRLQELGREYEKAVSEKNWTKAETLRVQVESAYRAQGYQI